MARHRLVTIGDSITQGVRSGASWDGTLAWPTVLARAMGIDDFHSPIVAPYELGAPINLEYLAESVIGRYGSELNWHEIPRAALRVRSWMDRTEDHWEEMDADDVAPDGPFHNLGILGFDLRDALSLTAHECDVRIPATRQRDDFISQIPDNAGLRIARRVLGAAGRDATVLDAAQSLADDGGIEVAIVMLGSNNALQVASELRLVESEDGFDDLDRKGDFSLWRPEHFAIEYDRLAERIEQLGAEHSVLSTVPNVTIAPIARGVRGKVEPGSPYFEFYTRPWIDDADFSTRRDPHITHVEAAAADAAIAEYNDHIRAVADRIGAHVFDLSGLLDSMATRRYLDDPDARPPDFEEYSFPPPLDQLQPRLGTEFFRSENGVRVAGGIVSLDGIHPTVIGSALVAHELALLLADLGVDVGAVDLGAALAADRLNSNPPDIVDSALGVIGWLDQFADIVTHIARLGR